MFVLVFMLVERGLLAPLIVLVLIIALVVTPRPISLVAQRNGGKKRTRSCAARGFVKLALRVLRGVVLVETVLRRILLVKGAVRLVAFFKLLVEVVMLLLFLLCYYVVDMWVLIFVLLEKQALVSD